MSMEVLPELIIYTPDGSCIKKLKTALQELNICRV